jgi:hypothetical protein
LFSSVTNSAQVQAVTSPARNGAYALRVNADGSAGGTNASVAVSGSPTVLVARTYVRFAALPATDANILAFTTSVGGPQNGRITYKSGSARLAAAFEGGVEKVSTVPIATDTWYRVDVRLDASASTFTLDWQVNGTNGLQATYAAGAAGAFTNVRLGTGAGFTYECFYDDVAVSTTSADYPLGDGKVVALRANSVATANANFSSQSGGTASFLQADDSPWGLTTDYIRQNGGANTDYIGLGLQDSSSTFNARAVRAIAGWHSEGTNANNGQTRFRRLDGTETTVKSGAMNQTSIQYSGAMLAAPGGGWTAAEVNGLVARVGYSSDVDSVPAWDAAMVEAEYPNSTTAEANLSISLAGYNADGSGPTSTPATSALGILAPGTTAYAETRVTVTTDDSNGYSLAAMDADGAGAMASGADIIPWSGSGSVAAPGGWSGSGIGISAFGGSATPNRWCNVSQANCTSVNDADLFWADLTNVSQSVTSKGSAALTGDTTRIPMRITMPNLQTAGAYTGQVVFTATAAP